ncbi:hypothetical protein ABT58_20410 [Photobacterium aphoticum]|uniref:CheW-like domain-containing protein n=1 Tax=Photobacterium aphoticum TaxID=754436 RepID=A0A0J1GHF7_9GAMM|nr:hypothetical protein ABT58_20410 [Photobacterium aphoticum]
MPRPDDTALSASVGDVNADQDTSSTPFDFASLDEEDAPLQPALALSPLEVAPSPRVSWFDVPAERDDLQRLLSQVSLLAEQTEVEAEVEAPSAEPDDTALSDDWALVMAHDADHAQAVDLVPDSALDITTDAPLSSIEINTVSATEQDMALPDITVQDLSVAETDLSTDLATGIVTDIATGIATDTALASETETKTALATQAGADLPPDGWQQQEVLGDEFQALFFEVHGVTFAVPLTELGGIHQLGEVSHLFGRPPWYLGLMTNRDHSLDVVDTARWVMPERLVDDAHRDAYRYLVMLGESRWGLACDSLQGTQTLHEHSVRWREQAGKRPWLAGMVKEKMCALIHVPELIAMLDAGLDVQTTLQQA